MNKIARRRELLWNENPHCSVCNVLTLRPADVAKEFGMEIETMMGKLPPDVRDRMASLDHVFNRFDKERRTSLQCTRTQLMCHKCNNDKGKADFEALTPEQKRRVQLGLQADITETATNYIESRSGTLGDAARIIGGDYV